jgi:diguanylate cyclase (GGDEF)-like protein
MYCEQVCELLSAFLDHEVPTDERALIDLHLAKCAACRQVLEALRRQHQDLRRAFAVERAAARDFAQRLKVRLSGDETARPRCSVLVVDDESYLLKILTRVLEPEFEVHTAASGDDAKLLLGRHRIDLILADQQMPRMTGVELLEWVRRHSPKTVRLLMTGYQELEGAVAAINRGEVYRYLFKPCGNDQILATLRDAARAFLMERSHGHLLEELRQLNLELERRVQQRTAELEEANRELEQKNKMLEQLALTDPLTGLPNRRAMDRLAEWEVRRRDRYPSSLALGLIDVDHFKDVNTRYLLPGGDKVLIDLARCLPASLRKVDFLGRIGGEEFLVIAPETTLEGAASLGERVRSAVENYLFSYKGEPIKITISLGFAVVETGVPASYEQIKEVAAAALAEAKLAGRNRTEIRRLLQPLAG